MKSRIGLPTLACIALVAFGFTAGLVLMVPPAVPPSLASDKNESSEFTPIRQELNDSQDVKLNVAVGGQALLTAPSSGTVTARNCSAGQQLNSWDANFSIDGSPLLNLSTSTPLWRDLKSGDVGSDVLGIQTELKRLGYPVVADGVLGERTMRTVAKRLEELGATSAEPTLLAHSSILWLPASTVTAASCRAVLGASVTSGQTVADLRSTVTAVSVAAMPGSLLPGARVVVLDDARFALDQTGQITSSEDLIHFAGLPTYLASTGSVNGDSSGGATEVSPNSSAPSGGLSAKLELAEAVEAWAVPPGALTSIQGNGACVSERGKGIPVTIVGSELGKSFVTFGTAQQAPAHVDVDPVKGLSC